MGIQCRNFNHLLVWFGLLFIGISTLNLFINNWWKPFLCIVRLQSFLHSLIFFIWIKGSFVCTIIWNQKVSFNSNILYTIIWFKVIVFFFNDTIQSVKAVEYTDWIFAGRDVRTPPHSEFPGYDIKQSDGVAPALEKWWWWSTSLLPSLPGPLWPRKVVSDGVLSVDQIEQTMCANKCLM